MDPSNLGSSFLSFFRTPEVKVGEESLETEGEIIQESYGSSGYFSAPLISFELPSKVHSKFVSELGFVSEN